MLRVPIVFLLILNFLPVIAQDTVRIVHLNVLNYGNFTSYCTNSNNNPDQKAAALRKIVRYLEPEIFTVNELGKNPSSHKHILDSAFNTGGVDYYSRTSFSNTSNSSIINMLFYDNRKLALKWSDHVNTSLRDIDVHLLYYKDPLLGFTADTAFIYVFIAHLKAGSEAYDEQVRAAMTSDLMNWLDNINQAGNYVLCGDFNLKSNAEQAWYNLTSYPNSAIVFHDPAQMEGSWTGNPAFQTVHSQSTHLNGNSCASGGGLDDRFDFIMLSEQIMEGDEHYQYQEGSYNVLGQDGLRLNGSVLSPANTEVPEEIAWALYDASDHLPVVVDLLVDQHWTGLNSRPEYESIAIWIQHFNQASVSLGIRDPSPLDLAVSIYSMTGEIAQRAFFTTAPGSSTCQLDVPSLAPGMYVMQISDGSRSTVLKFMKP